MNEDFERDNPYLTKENQRPQHEQIAILISAILVVIVGGAGLIIGIALFGIWSLVGFASLVLIAIVCVKILFS